MSLADLVPKDLPDAAKVKVKQVAEWLGITDSTVTVWEKNGRLPKLHRLGPRTSYFLAGELRAALNKLEEKPVSKKRR